jgi:hypothetical protein
VVFSRLAQLRLRINSFDAETSIEVRKGDHARKFLRSFLIHFALLADRTVQRLFFVVGMATGLGAINFAYLKI